MNLNQITVPSLELTKLIPFYVKLGLKLIEESLPHYARLECPDGNSTFSIHQGNIFSEEEGVYVYFECDKLDEQVEEIKERGIVFDQEPIDQRWLWRETRLKDVEGNQLILFYAGENRVIPPCRIENN